MVLTIEVAGWFPRRHGRVTAGSAIGEALPCAPAALIRHCHMSQSCDVQITLYPP